ncbi:MAG TPA: response regulator [Acidimicrobiales bacterium]|nr:response regulator [Acidimicrobiales bacterium]
MLLVDDNRLNQLVAAGTLKRLNYATEIVSSGAKAVEACSQRTYDAVLMDIMMPGMDGFEATARIRALDQSRSDRYHTPVIGVSARALDGDREHALAAGLDDYLTKPIREDELKATLQRWIFPMPVAEA